MDPSSVTAPALPTEVSSVETGGRSNGSVTSPNIREGLGEAIRQHKEVSEGRTPTTVTPQPAKTEVAKPTPKKPDQATPKPVDQAKPDPQKPTNGEQQPKLDGKTLGEMRKKAESWDKGELPPAAQEKLATIERRAAEAEARLESLKSEYEGSKGELTENRTWRAAFEMQLTPEYVNGVTRPFEEAESEIAKIGDKFFVGDPEEDAGLQAAKKAQFVEDLWDAATQPDRVDRARAVNRLLKDHPEGGVVKELLQEQIQALQSSQQKHNEMEKHAEGLRAQINANRQQQTQAQTAKQQQEATQAAQEVTGTIKNTFPELFASQDPEIQKHLQDIDKRQFVDNPMERAIGARAVPVWLAMNTAWQKAKADLEAAKATIAELSGARGGDGLARPSSGPKLGQPAGSFADGLRGAVQEAGHRF